MTIASPYDPDDCIKDFGWLWTDIDGAGKRWNLVATRYLRDDEDPVIRFIQPGEESLGDFEEAAEAYRGRPYLPCDTPACGPQDALLITLHTDPGAPMQIAWREGRDVAPILDDVLAALKLRKKGEVADG